MFTALTKQMYRDWTNIAKKKHCFSVENLMLRSNSTSSEGNDPSVWIQYEMEDESQENRNCEPIDFVCSETDADSNTRADRGWPGKRAVRSY